MYLGGRKVEHDFIYMHIPTQVQFKFAPLSAAVTQTAVHQWQKDEKAFSEEVKMRKVQVVFPSSPFKLLKIFISS